MKQESPGFSRGEQVKLCCDMHNRNCEPPSEMCCNYCTERCHGMHECERGWTVNHHGRLEECIAPDLRDRPVQP